MREAVKPVEDGTSLQVAVVQTTSSTKDNPIIVIVDNPESHLAPEVLNIAEDNGMILLTIPPHTNHKLQTIDVSVFGPFQHFYNVAADSRI